MAFGWQVYVELGVILVLSWVAIRLGAYALSGALTLVGCFILAAWGGGWVWGAQIIIYYGLAILWYHFGRERKAVTLDRLLGQARVGWQTVLARLAWGSALAAIAGFAGASVQLAGGFTGVLAVAAADTWATEIGVLGRPRPRRLFDGRPMSAGTPGAISLLGIVSAAGGAWLIGFTALAGYFIIALDNSLVWSDALLWLPIAATIGGLVGSIVDSLLGSTAQGMYYCEHCALRSEEPIHRCGLPAQQTSGWRWLTDQGVDLTASLVGAAVTAAIVLLARLSL